MCCVQITNAGKRPLALSQNQGPILATYSTSTTAAMVAQNAMRSSIGAFSPGGEKIDCHKGSDTANGPCRQPVRPEIKRDNRPRGRYEPHLYPAVAHAGHLPGANRGREDELRCDFRTP